MGGLIQCEDLWYFALVGLLLTLPFHWWKLIESWLWQPNWISPLGLLITMLLDSLLEVLFPCESLQVRKKRFAPAIGQNFTGHRVWTCSSPLTCHTITFSLPFFVAGIIPEFGLICRCQWHHTYNYHHWWYGMMHPNLLSRYSSWTKKCVTVNGTHHTSLGGLFYTFRKPNLFLFNILFFTLPRQCT